MAKFTKEMREKYTILIPSMLDFHMQLFQGIFTHVGFKAEIMTNEGQSVIDEGLKYVHNDICYPALLVIGQCIDNLKKRENTDDVAVLITQTGGGCRASNYKFLLKKALEQAGFGHVPILTFNFAELQKVPEIGISYKTLFNKDYKIRIKKIPAELYVQNSLEGLGSKGIYSIYKGWIKEPFAT